MDLSILGVTKPFVQRINHHEIVNIRNNYIMEVIYYFISALDPKSLAPNFETPVFSCFSTKTKLLSSAFSQKKRDASLILRPWSICRILRVRISQMNTTIW
jgi:hypothetical protein